MSYEALMGFGGDGNGEDVPLEIGVPPEHGMVFGERIDIEPVRNGNDGAISSPLAIGGLLALVGGVVLFAVAIPFGIGAAAGAVAAPEGRKKRAAKWGALAGGLGGLSAYPIVYGLTGSSGIARSASSIAPIALGAYMGMREKEALEAESTTF